MTFVGSLISIARGTRPLFEERKVDGGIIFVLLFKKEFEFNDGYGIIVDAGRFMNVSTPIVLLKFMT